MKRLLVAFLLGIGPAMALGQRVTAPVEIIPPFEREGGEDLLDRWAQCYMSIGTEDCDSATLRKSIVEMLCPKADLCPLNFQRPHSIVFAVPTNATVEQPRTLVRLLVWEKEDPVYATNLRGTDQLIEVFISPAWTTTSDTLNSVYTSTAVEDPRGADLAAALKQLGPTLFALLGPSPAAVKGPAAQKKFRVSVRRVVIPFRRAKISVKSQLVTEIFPTDPKKPSSFKVTANSEVSYDNAPPNHIGFSLMGAGIIRVGGARRTKLDNAKIVESSFDGAASIVALNVHPWSYDPTVLPISAGERWRLFLGIVATPELGLAAGGGWAPFRNLSINAGYAWLRVKTTKGGEAIGGSPPDGDMNPLRHGTARAFVFGVGYKFS